MNAPIELPTFPLTPDRWADFERLFGSNGACGGCWCTWFCLTRVDFYKKKGDEKKAFIYQRVKSGNVPGLLAYWEGIPRAWVAVAPREQYPTLDRSFVSKRVDDQPVWSITCFFIDKHYRRRGWMLPLIQAACSYAQSQGANLIEAYPYDPVGKTSSGGLYYGVASTFSQAGFVEVARRSPHHPVMRFSLDA